MGEVNRDVKLLRERKDFQEWVFRVKQKMVNEVIPCLLEKGYLLIFGLFNGILFCIFTDNERESIIRS